MTVQPDLPWNVAGIAPEAREAARTSARREGLSVGEWLTRRILKGIPDAEASLDEWWLREPVAETTQGGARSMLSEFANLATIENRNERRHAKVDEPINSALHEIAAQVRLAARERTDDADQLSARIAQLDTRLAGMERNAALEDVQQRDTLKALQAKIAGLAEQISRTATRGLAQNTELARTIEAVAGKVSQYRSEADAQHKEMDERVCAVADNVDLFSGKLDQDREETERQMRAANDRVAAIELAVDTIVHDGDAMARLDGSLGNLTRRVETTEAEYLNNIERVETRLGRIEANAGEMVLDRRLTGIEQTLSEMARLIGKTVGSGASASEPRSPGAPPEGEGPREDVQPPPFAAPILDLPPFPERAKTILTRAHPEPATPAQDLRATLQPVGGGPDDAAQPPIAYEFDSVLAAARRTARAANSAQPRNASFSWVDPAEAHPKSERGHARFFLLGGLGLLVLAAIGTGLYLSSTSRTTPVFRAPGAVAHLVHARPVVLHYVHGTASVSLTAPRTVTATAARRPNPPTPVSPARPKTATAKPLAPQQRLAALAVAGNARAQEVLGLAYVDGDGVAVNEAEGAKWLERAATRGQAVAAYRLGTLYERGHGVAADHAKATRWYAVAAEAGNRKAMHNLAVAYAQGTGVQKDISLAARWFLRAANLGLPDSEFNLAVLYERGLGVPHSLKEAYKWYTIAAAEGDAESRTRMQAIASQLRAADKVAGDKAAAGFHPPPVDRAANAPPVAASLVGG